MLTFPMEINDRLDIAFYCFHEEREIDDDDHSKMIKPNPKHQ